MSESYVVDRHGLKMPVRFDLITERNAELCRGVGHYGPRLASLDPPLITAEVVRRFRNGMSTRQLDHETAQLCTSLATRHSDYEWLAARIYLSDLHKRTPTSLLEMVRLLISEGSSRLSPRLVSLIEEFAPEIDARMVPSRDYLLRYFGFQTIAKSYLLRPSSSSGESSLLDSQTMERPHHLYMRIAIALFMQGNRPSLQDAFMFYDMLSTQKISNATPTMLNAGTRVPQMSSCFTIPTADDLKTLFDVVSVAAMTSKTGGGVAISLHGVRAKGSEIHGTGGRSSGIQHYIKVLNETQVYVDQGGKRPGAFALYLSLDHDDIFTYMTMPRKKGEMAIRRLNAPEVSYAAWVPDLFMEALEAELANDARVAAGGVNDSTAGDWYLFCPNEAKNLHLVYGDEYRKLVAHYVAQGKHRRCVKARELFSEAFKTWAQMGKLYWMYKDNINRKSNMMNIAPITMSNLCCEVLISTWTKFDSDEYAKFNPDNAGHGETGVCNLAAICLESYIIDGDDGKPKLDLAGIMAAAALEVRALNRVIDQTHYPSEDCRASNQRHRPIGIGIMGLADVLVRLGHVYGSESAQACARSIAAVIYYASMNESAELARVDGAYSSFSGSPTSKGQLQPDLWQMEGTLAADWESEIEKITDGYLTPVMWRDLRETVTRGIRNVYVTAYMPTATTSNLVGQNECFEPFTSNIYTRTTLAGEFLVVNRHLMRELTTLGLWDDKMRRRVVDAAGSIQSIPEIPEEIRRRYRTSREIHPVLIVRMAKQMAPFICQSMSMNAYFTDPDMSKILRFLMEGWKAGLKTGMYYCHTAPATGSQKTSVKDHTGAAEDAPEVCTRDDPTCTACSV